MQADSGQFPDSCRPVWSWAVSLLLHSLMVVGAALLLSDLRLAPEPEPFRWEVAMVDSTRATETAKIQQPSPQRQRTSSVEPSPKIERELRQVVRRRQDVTRSIPARPVPADVVEPVTPPETRPNLTASPVPSRKSVSESAMVPRSNEPRNNARNTTRETAKEGPVPKAPAAKPESSPDYSWLGRSLWSRVQALKRYPLEARLNHLEGRVVLRIVIQEDGQLRDVAVVKSSGRAVLDRDAIELVRSVSPLTLTRPLGRPQVVVQVPISYRLERQSDDAR